mmetsp:Transcript_1008/g.2580  ORF Transcript_1008/g.2580 Transcript_1008/m.2580 type:complete len:203 (-) Transcript_1008:2-610(-)
MPGTKKSPLPSAAITRWSKHRPNIAPAAVKCPFSAATVGMFSVRILFMRFSASAWIRVDWATLALMYCRSMPLQKNLPSPVTTRAWHSCSAAASRAALTCLMSMGLILCSLMRVPQSKCSSGDSMVTTATLSTTSVFSSGLSELKKRPARPARGACLGRARLESRAKPLRVAGCIWPRRRGGRAGAGGVGTGGGAVWRAAMP